MSVFMILFLILFAVVFVVLLFAMRRTKDEQSVQQRLTMIENTFGDTDYHLRRVTDGGGLV